MWNIDLVSAPFFQKLINLSNRSTVFFANSKFHYSHCRLWRFILIGTHLNCLFQTDIFAIFSETYRNVYPICSNCLKRRIFLLLISFSICFLHQLNLLVATNVAEEGLDIQTCCLVVRFDLPQTVSSFIQSRGRARMLTSEYVFLLERYFLVSVMSASSCIRICLY